MKAKVDKSNLMKLKIFCTIDRMKREPKGWASQVLVAHACNPGYSGCRKQEDQGLKLVQTNS
jgi:hypothetical protein